MKFTIDDSPPPISLTEGIAGLEVGKSLLASEATIRTIRTIVGRVKERHPERSYRTSNTNEGPRVWRLA